MVNRMSFLEYASDTHWIFVRGELQIINQFENVQLIQKYIHIELNEALNLRKQKYRCIVVGDAPIQSRP